MWLLGAAVAAGALLALCVDAGLIETSASPGALSTELVTDDACSREDEDCSLSLRQLRGKDLQAQVSAHDGHSQDALDDDADPKLLAGLMSRAADQGHVSATALDKGYRCKIVHDGIFGTVTYGLFRIADQNGDGEVQLHDITGLVDDLDQNGEKRLQELFKDADKDGSKSLSKQEVARAVQKFEQLNKQGGTSGRDPPISVESGEGGEADRQLLASLLMRTGEQGDATTLDGTIYCKRSHYYAAGPYPHGPIFIPGSYLEQAITNGKDSVAGEDVAAEAKRMLEAKGTTSRAEDLGDGQAGEKLIAGLLSRATDQGQDRATALDKGYRCKIVRDGIYRTVTYGLFRTADQNGDGEVQLRDITGLVDDLDQNGEKDLQELFKDADKDGSKSLSKQEVMQAVQRIGQLHNEGLASGEGEVEAGRQLLASLLAQSSEANKAAALDQTVYCKRSKYFYTPGWEDFIR